MSHNKLQNNYEWWVQKALEANGGAYFKLLWQHLPDWTEQNYENCMLDTLFSNEE
jgi:hypothetical protein